MANNIRSMKMIFKLIYKCDAVVIIIPMDFCRDLYKIILKFLWKINTGEMAVYFLKQYERVDISYQILKFNEHYFKQNSKFWHKNRNIYHCKEYSVELYTNTYGSKILMKLIF